MAWYPVAWDWPVTDLLPGTKARPEGWVETKLEGGREGPWQISNMFDNMFDIAQGGLQQPTKTQN